MLPFQSAQRPQLLPGEDRWVRGRQKACPESLALNQQSRVTMRMEAGEREDNEVGSCEVEEQSKDERCLCLRLGWRMRSAGRVQGGQP